MPEDQTTIIVPCCTKSDEMETSDHHRRHRRLQRRRFVPLWVMFCFIGFLTSQLSNEVKMTTQSSIKTYLNYNFSPSSSSSDSLTTTAMTTIEEEKEDCTTPISLSSDGSSRPDCGKRTTILHVAGNTGTSILSDAKTTTLLEEEMRALRTETQQPGTIPTIMSSISTATTTSTMTTNTESQAADVVMDLKNKQDVNKLSENHNHEEKYKDKTKDEIAGSNSTAAFVFTFPSIEERVKYYMGSWYEANSTLLALLYSQPCPRYYYSGGFDDDDDGDVNTNTTTSYNTGAFHQSFLFDRINSQLPSTRSYGQDTLQYLLSAFTTATTSPSSNVNDINSRTTAVDNKIHTDPIVDPVVVQLFGDISVHANHPLIQKARFAVSRPTDWSLAAFDPQFFDNFGTIVDIATKYRDDVGASEAAIYAPASRPIPPIGLLGVKRHFGKLDQVLSIAATQKNNNNKRHHHQQQQQNTSTMRTATWKDKKEVLFWRGSWTGRHRFEIVLAHANVVGGGDRQNNNTNDTNITNTTENDNDDPLFDIGFMKSEGRRPEKNARLEALGLLKDPATREEQLQYKYLLSIEGNDVASGLKWMLLAPDTVVFMSPPTRTTWAMEEWLVPYYHYIPIMANGSDILEKVAWARKHDDECQTISKHATEFIMDLYVSKRAQADTWKILQRILSKYTEQYGEWLSSCRDQDPDYQRMRKRMMKMVETTTMTSTMNSSSVQ